MKCVLHSLQDKNEPFLSRIVTCDEKWVVYDNTSRSRQLLDKAETPKHFPKPSAHQNKVMFTVWWASFGIIHYSFLNPGVTINDEKYCTKLMQCSGNWMYSYQLW